MRSGGWTLIGQIGGVNDNIYNQWLVTNHNTGKLRTPVIEKRTYGCIDAVDLAVNYAHEIRLSSGESDTGMGQFWVEWDLPADRDVDTFWRHSVGLSVAWSAARQTVEVRSSFRSKQTCCHTKYGIGPAMSWGGGYPTSVCGAVGPRDSCMQVAVMSRGSSVHGFDNSFALFDAPTSNSDWPNRYYSGTHDDAGRPFLSVWLR
ncbi:hypothetical protein LSAT2_021234 [Lamellibrachia satsuma]|nr:hypothetical protein LSAT2_021234 [Lamellibrachia satsuma]